MAHRLQTVGKVLEGLFRPLLQFVEQFSLAVTSRMHFGRGQRLREQARGLKLVASQTRWSSSFETVDSMLQHWEGIKGFLASESELEGPYSVISNLAEGMERGGEETREQAEAFTTVGRAVWSSIGVVEGPDPLAVWPTVMQLRGTLTSMAQHGEPLVKEAAVAVRAQLVDRSIWDDFGYARELQVLHPERKKGTHTYNDTHTYTHTHHNTQRHPPSITTTSHCCLSPSVYPPDIDSYPRLFSATLRTALRAEWATYMEDEEVMLNAMTVLEWWKAKAHLYCTLAPAAMAALCPCHSAVVESSFSRMTALTMDKRRKQMKVAAKEDRLFVAFNCSGIKPPPHKRKREEPTAAASAAARRLNFDAHDGLEMELGHQEEVVAMQAAQSASYEAELVERVGSGQEGLFWVESIVAYRKGLGYLVRWLGAFPGQQETWEPPENVEGTDCEPQMLEFLKRCDAVCACVCVCVSVCMCAHVLFGHSYFRLRYNRAPHLGGRRRRPG
jgi:hypothetical protein